MAKTVPDTYTEPARKLATPGEIVFLTNLRDIARQSHYLWSRRGMISSGRIFDPPFETTSAVLTVTDEGPAEVDLNTIYAIGRVKRVVESVGVRQYRFLVAIYARFLEFEVVTVALDTGATLSTDTIETDTGDSECLKLEITITEAQGHIADNTANDFRLIGFKFRARLRVGGQTGKLWYIGPPRETFGTAALLPTS